MAASGTRIVGLTFMAHAHAQLAPLAESVPPKLYGGTERVVFWLIEELVGGQDHYGAHANS